MCANICPLLKQNYPYNPNGIHISMYVMLCVWGTLAWSQWFTNLHVGYLYVCACVCVFVKKIMLDLTLVTFFIRLSLSKTGKRATANHPKSANLQIWMKYCSVSIHDDQIFALIGTLAFQYSTSNSLYFWFSQSH